MMYSILKQQMVIMLPISYIVHLCEKTTFVVMVLLGLLSSITHSIYFRQLLTYHSSVMFAFSWINYFSHFYLICISLDSRKNRLTVITRQSIYQSVCHHHVSHLLCQQEIYPSYYYMSHQSCCSYHYLFNSLFICALLN